MIQSKDDVTAIIVKLIVFGWQLFQVIWVMGIPLSVVFSVKQYRAGKSDWSDWALIAVALASVVVLVLAWGWYSSLPDHPLPR